MRQRTQLDWKVFKSAEEFEAYCKEKKSSTHASNLYIEIIHPKSGYPAILLGMSDKDDSWGGQSLVAVYIPSWGSIERLDVVIKHHANIVAHLLSLKAQLVES